MLTLTYEDGINLLKESEASPSLLRHAIASAAVMKAFAKRLQQDDALWEITGLLHDLDYPYTESSPEKHGLESARQLQDKLPQAALEAIQRHNGEMNGTTPQTAFDFALRAGETVTGLISAAALMRPTGYDGMEVKSIKKKMKDKAFAANVNRNNIRECEKAGLQLDEFLAMAISAMANMPKTD